MFVLHKYPLNYAYDDIDKRLDNCLAKFKFNIFLDMLASSLSSAKQTNLKTLKMKLTDKLSPCLTIELELVILFMNNNCIKYER